MDWQHLRGMDLVVFSTRWCGDCRRLKKIFERNQVPFEEIDIDANPEAAAELKAATGRGAIPFVKLRNNAFVRGWHDESPGRFDDRIFLSEVAEASS